MHWNMAKTVQIRTVDTDVVAILAGTFHDLTVAQPFANIWVAFGMGKNYRFYHINAICEMLGERRSRALPVFHAFSGCDTTYAFMERARSRHGRYGKPTKMSQRRLHIWPITHLNG